MRARPVFIARGKAQESCRYIDTDYYDEYPDCPRCKLNKEHYPRHTHTVKSDLTLKDACAIGGVIGGSLLLIVLIVWWVTK